MAGWVDVIRKTLAWLSGTNVVPEGWEVERVDVFTSYRADVVLFPEYATDVEIQTAFTVQSLKVSGE